MAIVGNVLADRCCMMVGPRSFNPVCTPRGWNLNFRHMGRLTGDRRTISAFRRIPLPWPQYLQAKFGVTLSSRLLAITNPSITSWDHEENLTEMTADFGKAKCRMARAFPASFSVVPIGQNDLRDPYLPQGRLGQPKAAPCK